MGLTMQIIRRGNDMKRHLTALGAAALLSLALGSTASAQNLVITNARVLDGTGKTIENGTIIARNGRIVSVTAGAAPAASIRGLQRLDAKGMTVLPGFIDAHRHIIGGEATKWLADEARANMKSFL